MYWRNCLILTLLLIYPALHAEDPWSLSRAHPVTADALPHEHHHAPPITNGLIRFYQVYISPLSGSTCRYTPTCSRYTAEAVAKFGIFKGIVMGTDRLIRCHPGQREYPVDPPVEY